MTDDPENHDDNFEKFLVAQRAAWQPRSVHQAAASQRFQFTLGRMLASTVPLAMASLFLHYAVHFPAAALVAIDITAICSRWAAAIFFRNMELVLIVPVCLVIFFALLLVGD